MISFSPFLLGFGNLFQPLNFEKSNSSVNAFSMALYPNSNFLIILQLIIYNSFIIWVFVIPQKSISNNLRKSIKWGAKWKMLPAHHKNRQTKRLLQESWVIQRFTKKWDLPILLIIKYIWLINIVLYIILESLAKLYTFLLIFI